MARMWSLLLVMILGCLVAVNTASAQDKKERKGGDRPSPEQRFDDMEKTVKHDPLKGELTKDEFVKALKETKSRMADKGEELFGRIKKADANKVTKDEYVKAIKEMRANRGPRGEKK